ncbi:MAG: outer membrane beta-barrel protein [Acidobacteriota bacterium]|nr:outer membrane beta-barrel protein [Acidobacteriota bacterium]
MTTTIKMLAKTAILKFAFCVCLLLVVSAPAASDTFSIQARGAYFIPSEAVFKDIYDGGVVYGGEISLKISGGLSLWAGGSYFNKSGVLTFTEESTTLQLIPIFGGLQYKMNLSRISPYVGAGVGYVLYKEENPIGKVEDGGLGFIGKAGVQVMIAGPLFLDVQASYSVCRVIPGDIEADLGGLKAGLGLGLQF